MFTFDKLFSGKAVFLKYWYIGQKYYYGIQYNRSPLPGIKDGIYGSSVTGNSIGIIKNIAKDKKDAALEVLKYFNSKEYQRNQLKNDLILTSINEIYDDKESCQYELCDIAKNVQFTMGPKFIRENPDKYKKNYKKYIYQFLYENKTIEETLKQINDMTKIYYVSLNTEITNVGLICLIYFSVISILMFLSLIFLFRENFHPFFMFLSDDFWIITVLGSIVILWVPLTNYGPVTTLKCHLKPLLISVGYTLNICPSLHKLIIQFPEKKKYLHGLKTTDICFYY